MKKLGLILACVAGFSLLPVSLSAGHFSFNVLFDATALLCRPCLPPPVIERRIYVTPPPPCPYFGGTTIIKEYRNPYCCMERRVIVTRPWGPYYPCIPY